jgi:DNA-binding MarR family transcriptional regulator|tara:strand:+ start:28433 stop:28957 length:525 start_codon:yes stop_codon:yes gene_type:complete
MTRYSPDIFERNLHDEIIFLLFDIGNFFNKKGDLIAKKAGLTTLQWIVLLHIAREPNLPIVQDGGSPNAGVLASEIAANRGVSRANISQVISILNNNGFISQADHPMDRRRKVLHITNKGINALKSIQDERRFLNDRLFEIIPSQNQLILVESLKDLLETVSDFPHVSDTESTE